MMKVIYDPRLDKLRSSLSSKDTSEIIGVVDLFRDYKFNLHQKYLKKLRAGLWELRAEKFRLLFGVKGETAIIVNIFRKQTQKTPKKAIKLSIKRLKEYDPS